MMNGLSIRWVLAAAAAFVVLDQLWLAGGNAEWVPENLRSVFKVSALLAAGAVYVSVCIYSGMRADGWVRAAALHSGAAVGLGLFLIVTVSAIWRRGHFFHDSETAERLPVVIAFIAAATLIAATIGPVVASLARFLARTKAE
jgi:hypothetical protein